MMLYREEKIGLETGPTAYWHMEYALDQISAVQLHLTLPI